MPNIGAVELLIVFVVLTIPWIAALIDVARRPESEWEASGHRRMTWILVLVLMPFLCLGALGALLYALIPLGDLRRAHRDPGPPNV